MTSKEKEFNAAVHRHLAIGITQNDDSYSALAEKMTANFQKIKDNQGLRLS